MKRTAWPAILGLTLAAASLGCPASREASPRNLVVTGSPIMAPLVQEIGKRFEAAHPGVRVDVQRSSSERGIADTRQGLADLGMAARSPRPEELPLHVFALARDGIGLLIHKNNPVPSLTDEQVGRLFTRTLTSWKPLGGISEPITVVAHADNRAIHQVFLEFFKLKSNQVRPDVTAGDSAQAIQVVAGQPQAIAYVSIGPAEEAIHAGSPVRLLPRGTTLATVETVSNGSYPLTRSLNLMTRDPPNGLVREFIDFAQSAEIHDVIHKFQFVPLRH